MASAWPRLFRWRWLLVSLCLIAAGVMSKAWHDTMTDPTVLQTSVELPGLPPGTRALKVVLISDIHVAGPDMPPGRLQRFVRQINALKPDAVLIAGDLVSDKSLSSHIYTPGEIVAPLGRLHPPLGTFVVPGNHDHWFDMPGLSTQLRNHGISLLRNEAAQAGPLVIGGLDDDYTGRAKIAATVQAMDQLSGARLILSHSPDPFPDLPESISLMLAGHTHCGQIRLPIIGAIATMSEYGNRFACGRVDEGKRSVIVGAGLGTSLMPVRFGTTAEIWLIELRPPNP